MSVTIGRREAQFDVTLFHLFVHLLFVCSAIYLFIFLKKAQPVCPPDLTFSSLSFTDSCQYEQLTFWDKCQQLFPGSCLQSRCSTIKLYLYLPISLNSKCDFFPPSFTLGVGNLCVKDKINIDKINILGFIGSRFLPFV